MKIENSHYLSGMPANDVYKIELSKGITLTLLPDEYIELCNVIGEKNGNDAEAIKKADGKFFKRAEKFQELIKDLRDIFYSGDEDGDILFRTETSKIDDDKLFDILDKHANVLGLE
jgi:hypothetical protein